MKQRFKVSFAPLTEVFLVCEIRENAKGKKVRHWLMVTYNGAGPYSKHLDHAQAVQLMRTAKAVGGYTRCLYNRTMSASDRRDSRMFQGAFAA